MLKIAIGFVTGTIYGIASITEFNIGFMQKLQAAIKIVFG